MLLAERFAFESRDATVEAVAAEAMPVPVGRPLITGVARVGVVPKTRAPEPVSSEITPASCDEVVAANCDSGLVVRASPAPTVAHDGAAVVPLLFSTCPDDPFTSIAVVPAAD